MIPFSGTGSLPASPPPAWWAAWPSFSSGCMTWCPPWVWCPPARTCWTRHYQPGRNNLKIQIFHRKFILLGGNVSLKKYRKHIWESPSFYCTCGIVGSVTDSLLSGAILTFIALRTVFGANSNNEKWFGESRGQMDLMSQEP